MKSSVSCASESDGDLADETVQLIGKKKSKDYKERKPLLHRSTDSDNPCSIEYRRPRESEDATTACTDDDDDGCFTDSQQYGSTAGDGFRAVLDEAIRAIHNGVFPERISQGSSGSYFVKNTQGKIVGVFKPKNEEPYGHLNPKWLKWFHKIFLPCCFGRSCLIPNQGYLSEAGASLLDRKLGLNVVPPTGIVELAAPTFYYGRFDRAKARTKERIHSRYPDLGRRFQRIGLPPKRGSFQLFVQGYNDAIFWLKQWETLPDYAPTEEAQKEFQIQFERMVILDYIIRNTDRGNDNWLIKYKQVDPQTIPNDPGPQVKQENEIIKEKVEIPEEDKQLIDISDTTETVPQQEPTASSSNYLETVATKTEEEWLEPVEPCLSIAAIDNGLAFPFKHPDEWRAYPFGWALLPQARKPFSEETINKILPLLDNTDFVKEIGEELRQIFKIDKGFDKKMFERQLSVVRGQIFNLREALRSKKSPYQLILMPAQYMVEVKQKKRSRNRRISRASETEGAESDIGGTEEPNDPSTTSTYRSWHETYQQKVQTRSPFFRWW